MSQTLLTKVSTGHYAVGGDLLMNTVMSVLNEMADSLKSESTIHIDFSKVTNSDSAAVALIIAWVSKAKQENVNIQFNHLPQQIIDIAKASDLLEILPIE